MIELAKRRQYFDPVAVYTAAAGLVTGDGVVGILQAAQAGDAEVD
jgi:hypothetical protein